MKKRLLLELLVEVAPEKIAFLKFILEGYDGLASISTISNQKGVVVLRYHSGSGNELTELLGSLPFVSVAEQNL